MKLEHPSSEYVISKPTAASQPQSVRFMFGIAMLLASIALDVIRPLKRSLSILYLLDVIYAAWFLRGKPEQILQILTFAAAFLTPLICGMLGIRPAENYFNRLTGSIVAAVLVGLVYERRHYIKALQDSNNMLEQKVEQRTAQLYDTNMSLVNQIAERQAVEKELSHSRQNLANLSRELISSQEAERRHLAHELHDEIGQALTAIKMSIRRNVSTLEPASQAGFQETVRVIDDAIAQVRNLSLSLRPPQLDELGLAAALHWLLSRQSEVGGFSGHLDVRLDEIAIPNELKIVCFRITQEALTNALRHANPGNVTVKLWTELGELHLTITDDGCGFQVADAKQNAVQGVSIGLISMQERANLVGGQFVIQSEPGSGTQIHVRFPLSPVT